MIGFPNAKINLGLNVTRRRPDGYHDIETVMMPIGWRDVLEIVPAKGDETTLTITGRTVDCPTEKNLVMKAYRAVAERFENVGPVDMYLHKIIPDGAGLGGGSADAAFTITLLNDLFSLGMDREQMAAIASAIGADCPFFIYNRPMLCTSTGTVMTPFTLPRFKRQTLLVVAKPQAGVSTARAYAGVTPRQAEPPVRVAAATEPEYWQQSLHNDFEPSVIAACPEIGHVKAALMSHTPLYCSMSGSGSAVYAFFNCDDADKMSASQAETAWKRELPGCDIFVELIEPNGL